MATITHKTLEKLSDFGMKHQKFLSFGLSALLVAVDIEIGRHFFPLMDHVGTGWQGLGNTLAIISTLPVTIATVFNTIITFSSGKDANTSIPEVFSAGGVNKALKLQREIAKPFKQQATTFEENTINEQVAEFFTTLFIINRPNTRFHYLVYNDNFRGAHVGGFDVSSYDTYESYLEPLYQKEFLHTLILPRCALMVIEGYSDAKKLFPLLWRLHGERFTQKEMNYLEKKLNHSFFNDGLSDNLVKQRRAIDFFSTYNIFDNSSSRLQATLIECAKKTGLGEKEYDDLVHRYKMNQQEKEMDKKQGDESQDAPTLNLSAPLAINLHSQKKLDTFEEKFNSLYTNEEDVLKSIQNLFLNKENLSYFLTHFDNSNQYIEAQLFLKNDVDKVLKSFKEEINILIKMKLNNYP